MRLTDWDTKEGQVLKRWAAVALVLVILGACSDEASNPGDADRHAVEVLSGKVQPSGELTVSVDACQGAPEVSVTETEQAVRIEVVATVHAAGPACADGVPVPLEQPLGERPLVDAHTGGTVEVVHADED